MPGSLSEESWAGSGGLALRVPAADICLPGTGGRTQAGCWANALEQGNRPVKGPIPLSWGLVLGGQDLSLGTLPFLVRTETNVYLVEVYRNIVS